MPQVVVCYGGSTIACIICGNPVAYVANEALASVAVATWTAIYLLPGPILGFMKETFPGKVLTSVTYEIMRTHVMINCSASACTQHPRTQDTGHSIAARYAFLPCRLTLKAHQCPITIPPYTFLLHRIVFCKASWLLRGAQDFGVS